MATAPRRKKPAGDVAEPTTNLPDADLEEGGTVALPHPAAEEEERKKVVLPEPVRLRWDALAAEATRKRTRVEVRLREGTVPEETAEGDLRGAFLLFATGRTGIATKIGEAELFGSAIDLLSKWVEAQADLGADVLREEIKALGRKLALLKGGNVTRRAGLPVVYLDLRDRILPLAWDNLVEAVKVERLEDFVRKIGALDTSRYDQPHDLDPIVEEARALVPKKATDADPD